MYKVRFHDVKAHFYCAAQIKTRCGLSKSLCLTVCAIMMVVGIFDGFQYVQRLNETISKYFNDKCVCFDLVNYLFVNLVIVRMI